MTSLLVFNRVYRLEIQSVMLVFFDPALWTIVPLNFSLVHLSPLPKDEVQYIYRQCVAERGWGC
jgi:hypothetical protein